MRLAGAINRPLRNRTIHVTRPDVSRQSIKELSHAQGWQVVFGRVRRAGRLSVAHEQIHLEAGDMVTVVGTPDDLHRVIAFLGEVSEERLDLDRSELDYRRILVSNPKIAGHRLRDLNLPQQFGAVVTRLRRAGYQHANGRTADGSTRHWYDMRPFDRAGLGR